MSDKTSMIIRTFDIRLITTHGRSMLFATQAAAAQEAVEYAKGLMLRHDCDGGEVWCGMELVRQL
jgi:hypothetical protein